MNMHRVLAALLDPALMLEACGLRPDPWQREFLLSNERQVLLNCSRQAGKSTVVSALALHTALFNPGALVLLASPSQRQSGEIYRKVLDVYRAMKRPLPAVHETQFTLELQNGSRIVSLPGREQTVRSYSGASLLVLDEAARVPDSLYRSVRPMLAVSQGRLVALSTPFGQRGWFYHEWVGDGPWKRVRVTWRDCPRISPAFIAEETRAMGQAWVDQEYNALFTAMEGLVYPDFASAIVEQWPNPEGRRVGGIDFGWRNPFAAVWGVRDRADVLWIEGERYGSEIPLFEHAAALRALPKAVWYADPAGRTETEELRAAGLTVHPGDNDIRPGIAAVAARLRTGRLKINGPACPRLLAEARLYRYPTASERALHGENPVDAHNHALAALRYLISRLDARFLARMRLHESDRDDPQLHPAAAGLRTAGGVDMNNPDLWTQLY
jgi:hypothetical protein